MSLCRDFLNGIHLYLEDRGLLVELDVFDDENIAEFGYECVLSGVCVSGVGE